MLRSDSERFSLFVYGSLMEGFFNYTEELDHLIIDRRPATVQGTLYHIENKGWPALIEGNQKVYGEYLLIRSAAGILETLDAIENYKKGDSVSSEYIRSDCTLTLLPDGEQVRSQLYRYNTVCSKNEGDTLIHIPEGSWRHYMMSTGSLQN